MSPEAAPKRPLGALARRETLHQVMHCRMLVLERRRRLARAEQGEALQGTDSECAYFLADLVEVEEEAATGVFRSAKRRRTFASARYMHKNWQPDDPLRIAFAQLDAIYRRC